LGRGILPKLTFVSRSKEFGNRWCITRIDLISRMLVLSKQK